MSAQAAWIGGVIDVTRTREAVAELRRVLCDTVKPDDDYSDTAPALPEAMTGFKSDATFYTRWERHRKALLALLASLDADFPQTEAAHD